ncbi:Gibberellin 2-beta-dioxygenase 8 [Morella rubra]|uniref:Gibberellin 2-beta-dioxygenase 8 n=1 Tax=Morella rubra TaxID=262757 RepID=A0A6A1VXM2_9ROSI|nr:Gibberellin 2-beta-dioxygenase 8 [Morella rubra]
MAYEPPLEETYKNLIHISLGESKDNHTSTVEEWDLPLIDLSELDFDRGKCIKEIAEAAREWGFFQVVNHGVSKEVLRSLQCEQMKVFHLPFERKIEENFLKLTANSYRWGNLNATSLRQILWSEALHISLMDISKLDGSLRSNVEAFTTAAADLAQSLAEILAQTLGIESGYFRENCLPNTSYLRMNRYPPCSFASNVFGLMPHTDSSFLTILYQDQVGGFQLMKDGKWLGVKPNPEALIINIGDLFQALSNGVFKSIKHKVVSTPQERLSVAYFYCPSDEAVIQSCTKPALYKKFSFAEYKRQTQIDVQETGGKVGLPRFLL